MDYYGNRDMLAVIIWSNIICAKQEIEEIIGEDLVSDRNFGR